MAPTKFTSPRSRAEPVSWYTSQFCAIVCIHVPTSEVNWPKNQSRKFRWRIAWKVDAWTYAGVRGGEGARGDAPPEGDGGGTVRNGATPNVAGTARPGGGRVIFTDQGRPFHEKASAAAPP